MEILNVIIDSLGEILGLALTYALIAAVVCLKNFDADNLQIAATFDALNEHDGHIVSGGFGDLTDHR